MTTTKDKKSHSHYIVVTGIIIKDGKFFIAKRSKDETAFPDLWTVPGGKLRKDDYATLPKDTSDHWYNVLEELLEREVKEECGLDIKDIRYLLSLAYIRSDGIPCIIMSFYCNYESGEVSLSEELTDYAWVSREKLEDYKFVPGLQEEIELVDRVLREGEQIKWKGKYDNPEKESLRDGAN